MRNILKIRAKFFDISGKSRIDENDGNFYIYNYKNDYLI